jgi:hypothetical protein
MVNMACEHKHLRVLQENPNFVYCLDCGKRFLREQLDKSLAEERASPKPINIRAELSEDQQRLILWLVVKKFRGLNYVLHNYASRLTEERKNKLENTRKLCLEIIDKLSLDKGIKTSLDKVEKQ